MKFKIYLFGLISFVACTSCNNAKKVKVEKQIEVAREHVKTEGSNFSIADFSLSLSDSWIQETPDNRMRKAQFALKDHPDVKIVVSYFGNVDNQINENIVRWEKQFSELKSSKKLELKYKGQVAVRIDGTYKFKAFPMAQQFEEKSDYGMLAAIIPTNEGPYFVKVTAPVGVIESEESNFIEVLNSYNKK